jgi:hypothetical protein
MNNINYKKEYERLHSAGFFKGYSCLTLKNEIKSIIQLTDSKTILDYGSGKGCQYSIKQIDEFWGVVVDCYDPYVKELSILPNKCYDGVLCTDVLEHVPENEVDFVLNNIFSRANKFAYFCIHTGKAVKKFSDGTNVHVTIKNQEFWTNLIKEKNTKNISLQIYFRKK